MRVSELVNHHRRQPFQPFRIHLSDGSSYEVQEPGFMYVTATTVVVGLPPLMDGVPERAVYCDPIHITRVEPLPNGRSKRSPSA
ncbi:MAG: hypothetical protein GY842_23815 [bacterium]|nr:hypothetical protein [bacterium]